MNIENEEIRICNEKIGQRIPESSDENQRKLEDYPTMDDKDVNPLKSSGRLIGVQHCLIFNVRFDADLTEYIIS